LFGEDTAKNGERERKRSGGKSEEIVFRIVRS